MFELDTESPLRSTSLKQFKRLFPDTNLSNPEVELRTYTIQPRVVAFIHRKYKGQTFIGKLYANDHQVDAIFGREWIREVDQVDVKVYLMKHKYLDLGG